MFARHPLEGPSKKLDMNGIVDALRLAIIAELDAISFYSQVARSVDDEGIKRLFEDVAREEKTHVGEFFEALKRLDPEQVREIEKGAEEARELLGIKGEKVKTAETKDPPEEAGLERIVREAFYNGVKEARVLRSILPTTSIEGRDAIVYYAFDKEGKGSERLLVLRRISLDFSVPEALASRASDELGALRLQGQRFALEEERALLEAIRSAEGVSEVTMGSWDEAGEAVNDISKAFSESYSKLPSAKYVLLLSPGRYSKLLVFHERSGVMELERVRRLVGEVVRHPLLKDDEAYIIPLTDSVADIAISQDVTLKYIGAERSGEEVFRAIEVLGLRIRYPSAIVKLVSGK